MKLLLITQYFWPESFSINEVASTLVKRGIELVVMTGKPNYPEGKMFPGYAPLSLDREDYRSIRIRRVPIITRGIRNPLRLTLNYLSFIVSGSLFGPWVLRDFRPDAILVYCTSPLLQAIPAILIGRIKKVPVTLYVQDLWPESLEATGYVRSRWIIQAIAWVVKLIYRHVDLILISSRPFEDSIRRMAPAARIVYLPNSVDGALCDPDSGQKPHVPALDSGFSVVFAGNIGAAQAVNVIVDAAALLAAYPGIRLVVLGSGSEFGWMQQQREQRSLYNLHLPGRFPADSMPYLLFRATALLVTLADRPVFSQTVPNKIQAYMAVGRPIIACLNGEGARLVTEAGAGIAVRAEDARGLAAAVLRLYRMSPERREQLGLRARQYYRQHFEHEKLVTEMVSHLQQAIGSKA
jgi:glycosyltransferase involved in cell wall biosynthesis